MSASAPRSGPPSWNGLVGRAGGWLPVLSAVACAWLLVGGVGCNSPLEFNMPSGGSMAVGAGGVGGGAARPDGGAGGETPPPPPPDARPDLPADMAQLDTGVDVPPDVPVPPDVRPDIPTMPEVAPDRAPEVAPDVPRDVQPDTLPPGTCNVEADCHANLHCDVAAHACQECVTNTHCAANATAKVCNTALTPNRCVECVDTTTCPPAFDGHGSTCFTDNFRCAAGCDDSIDNCPTTVGAGFVCDTSNLDHLCTECPAGTCTGSPRGPFCFGSRICAQCLSNANCTGSAAGPLCDLITGRCVRCRTSNDCAAPTPLCNPVSFTCVP